LELRPYQREAVDAIYRHLRERDDNPVVVLPTGAGKSVVLAQVAADAVLRWGGRVLVLAHRRELLEQNADKLRRLCPALRIGVYSAGLNRRDTTHAVLVAGIQSVYKRARELAAFDLIIIDEVHLLPLDGDGMYRQFLADARAVNPQLRVIGLTATPFRLDSGPICTPDHYLNAICYEAGIKELIRNGYLCSLVTKAGRARADTSTLHVRGGDFVTAEVEQLMDDDALVAAACEDIVRWSSDRQCVLIFAAGVRHAQHVQRQLQTKHDLDCGFVCGETPASQRDLLLARFRGETSQGLFDAQPLRYLVNADLLTVGFDCPRIDAVCLLRPTMSAGLYAQMIGRGLRLYPDKQNCLVLDYGGNVLRHGPVDQLKSTERIGGGSGDAPAKECPECLSLVATGYARCPDCGYEFPPPERKKHEAKASEAGILSGQVTDTEYEVRDVTYSVHRRRDADEWAPRSLHVDYRLGLNHWQSEFICLEHDGYARHKAVAWWRQRSPDPVPDTAERAQEIAEAGGLAHTQRITVRNIAGERFDRIVGYRLGPLPESAAASTAFYDPAEIPF
jgi:DNA repair protein RadD